MTIYEYIDQQLKLNNLQLTIATDGLRVDSENMVSIVGKNTIAVVNKTGGLLIDADGVTIKDGS